MRTYPARLVLEAAATAVLPPGAGDTGGPSWWRAEALSVPDACGAGDRPGLHPRVVARDGRLLLPPTLMLPHSP